MKTVLVVEDDADIQEALAIRLSAAGHSVVRAEDALQGLLAAVRERPDAMVLDISMPAGDGFSIVERLQESMEGTLVPVIYITASKRPEMRQRAEQLGAFAFFEKPYDAHALVEAVNDALADRGKLLTL